MDNSSKHLVVTIGEVHPFPDAKCNIEQALKILEEAAEVFCAWQDYDHALDNAITFDWQHGSATKCDRARENLLGECADLIMACTNMMHGAGQTVPDHIEIEDYKCPITKDHMRFLLAKASCIFQSEGIINNLVTADITMMTIVETCEIIANLNEKDFTPYMEACEKRNRERGRYDG